MTGVKGWSSLSTQPRESKDRLKIWELRQGGLERAHRDPGWSLRPRVEHIVDKRPNSG